MAFNDLKIPSKTFLIGEYAILYGGKALVLTHPPYFSKKPNANPEFFHPESPASRLMNQKDLKQDFDFVDPHSGGGGFGGSTAEAIASLKGRVELSPENAYEEYLDLFKEQKTIPSGADFYAQWVGADEEESGAKLTLFDKNDPKSSKSIKWPFEKVSILIFKRPKKTKTHQHLDSLNKTQEDFNSLIQIIDNALESLVNKDSIFFKHIDAFREEQNRLSLISEESLKEVLKIKSLSSVITARACGALGMDVVAVFCDSLKEDIDKVKAEIVDFDFNYKHIVTLDRGDFK